MSKLRQLILVRDRALLFAIDNSGRQSGEPLIHLVPNRTHIADYLLIRLSRFSGLRRYRSSSSEHATCPGEARVARQSSAWRWPIVLASNRSSARLDSRGDVRVFQARLRRADRLQRVAGICVCCAVARMPRTWMPPGSRQVAERHGCPASVAGAAPSSGCRILLTRTMSWPLLLPSPAAVRIRRSVPDGPLAATA